MKKIRNRTIYYINSNQESINPTIQKVKSFRALEPGWHWGEGVPINLKNIKNAVDLIKNIHNMGWINTDVFPGTDGEIAIRISSEKFYIEIIQENDLSFSLLVEEREGTDILDLNDLSQEEVIKNILKIRKKDLWIMQDYFPSIISTPQKGESIAWHSETQRTEVESQSSNWSAPIETLVTSAHM